MTEPVLTVENVTMRFGGLTAVDSVNFRVNQGEIPLRLFQLRLGLL